MFTPNDLVQIRQKGIEVAKIEKQINHFINGFPYIRLSRPAVLSDGILSFDEVEKDRYIEKYEQLLPDLRVVKFVPASGAASRMFKSLFEFKEKPFNDIKVSNPINYFFSYFKEIAFYEDLDNTVKHDGLEVDELLKNHDYTPIIDYILTEKGLNYSNLPKGLIKFHRYQEGARTSVEEHMVEAAEYARDVTNTSRLHFTISPEHREKFLELLATVQTNYEKKLKTQFDISFSIQKPSTDTIAVNLDNQPLRNTDGSLMFRPGGHGSLLDNLEDIDADIIFIKNIDNVVPDRLKGTTFQYKKLLGGYLLMLKQRINRYLQEINTHSIVSVDIPEIAVFAIEKLQLSIPNNFYSLDQEEQCSILFKILNRPFRVCGMVKNEGEPGGGPFWVWGANNGQSLQIVESSQINLTDKDQHSIFCRSTHFNPVDLVCCTKDFTGKRFKLIDFVDENTGFISKKSIAGKTVKAQELPGLWNGAMAGWITLFIEVPVITFNPVKIVNDLLRKEHLE
ncbi:MAG: DUF4301 family protein [Bacteroidales bacterium]|jgi:hypothetical protein|nr:DUF4301 family protein [Bacteroidales bacterium]